MSRLEYPTFEWEQQPSFEQSWDIDELQKQMFRRELARSPSFANCFNPKHNYTKTFLQDIKKRTQGEHPNSLVMQIIGRQGFGKTTLGFKIGKIIYPRFSVKNLFFRYEMLLNACKKAKVGVCFQLDEQTIEFGEGSLRQIKELQNIEEVTRILELHLIYCSPTLREHLASHYTLKVIQRNAEKRLTKFAFCSQDGRYYYGYGIAKIPLDDKSKIYRQYEPEKLEFAKNVLKRNMQKYDIWEKAGAIGKHPSIHLARKKIDLEILAQDLYPTLTIGEIKKIVNAFLMLQRRMQQAKSKADRVE